MNFREFQAERTALLAASPGLVDLAETNLWRALASLVPRIDGAAGPRVYRCHLAQAWLATFRLPVGWAPRALVSTGVRHSLSLIFSALVDRGRATGNATRLWLPVDVYPVYGELAKAAGLSFETFPTLPKLRLPAPAPNSEPQHESGEWLLLPNPLKPAGRWLASEEVSALRGWLNADPTRRVIIDAVYTFERQFHGATLALVETGQACVLHSLSKGWLHPQVFGVALVPDVDAPLFQNIFRENSPPQTCLQTAHRLLGEFSALPVAVSAELAGHRERLLSTLPGDIQDLLLLSDGAEAAGYLTAVQASARELLDHYRLLAIPLSAFGSPRTDYCVLSALPSRRE